MGEFSEALTGNYSGNIAVVVNREATKLVHDSIYSHIAPDF